ncbi:MAG: enoyl-CoA hydratase/isomerase family protein [Acidimicrobiales bacterium]|nr:enoyl-CoA hydratase/isomerase family protein [Acidimicrobiales bacterium]
MAGQVLYEVSDAVAWITLDQPDKLNAITFEMRDRLVDAVGDAGSDGEVRAVVLRGTGGCFTSGVDIGDRPDIQDPSTRSAADDRAEIRSAASAWTKLLRCPKPVLAQAERYCVGWGLEIALHADVVVSTPDCRFFFPSVRNASGLPDSIMVLHHLGPQWAKRLLLLGDEVDGRTAERIGLVSETAPAERIAEVVAGLAQRAAAVPLAQARHTKAVLNRAVELSGATEIQAFAELANAAIRAEPDAHEFSRRLRTEGREAALSWARARDRRD